MSALVALVLAVVVAFAGLAVDGGHLFLTKTELQNAADACALAASYELTQAPDIPPEAFRRAEAAGRAVAQRNRLGLQNEPVAAGQVDLRFAAEIGAGAAWSTAQSASPDARFVRCDVRREGVALWLLQVIGVDEPSVQARAVATLSPAQTNCGIPMAVCSKAASTASPAFGLVPGQWISGRFSTGGGVTGSFNWIDYSPPAGGANEVGELLRGGGQCSLNVPSPVGQPGSLGNAAARAWNTRFGLYQSGSDSISTAVPDFSGYAYTPKNWPSMQGAIDDFRQRRRNNEPYGGDVSQGNAITGLSLSVAYNPVTTTAQHLQAGGDRRLVVVPVVDCGDWAGSQAALIRGWACMFMLHPVANVGDPIYLEYAGLANEPGSPCASSGVPGDRDSVGPRVPALVQ